MNAFLEPHVGKFYENGIEGKRVLVLGASYYCDWNGNKGKRKCEFYEDCAINGNSFKYNNLCPVCKEESLTISNWYKDGREIDEEVSRTYARFFELMRWCRGLCATEKFDEFWEKVAFTNYVQHIIGGRINTLPSDCREEYLAMFVDTLEKLKPDIVIVWGCVVDKPLKNATIIPGHPECRNIMQENSGGYIFKWKNFNGHDITFLNIYHPSSSLFYTQAEWDNVYGLYMKKLFNL